MFALEPIHTQNKNLIQVSELQKFDEKFFIESTKREIQYFSNIIEQFVYSKKIKDIFGNNLFFMQFQNYYAIVSLDNFESLEISKNFVWDFWSLGYWYSFDIKNAYKKSLKKLFSYNSQKYSYTELKNKGLLN